MQTLKKLVLASLVALSLAGFAVGVTTSFAPSATMIADTSNQPGEYDAG